MRTIRPELSAAWLLAFALAAGNFAVPHVLQCRLYSIEIYMRLTNYLDTTGASRAALTLLAITFFAAVILIIVERGPSSWAFGAQTTVERIELGRRAWLVGGAFAFYLGITILLPVSAMAAESGTVEHFVSAARDAAPETANSLRTSFAASLVALFAGLTLGRSTTRKPNRALLTLSLAPVAVPALVLGLAYSQFYNRAWPIDLRFMGDGKGLLVLALTARAWPFAARAMLSGERSVASACHEAAWLAGLSRWRRATWLVGPWLAHPALAAGLIGYVLTVGEVEISQLLCAPGEGTLALRLFTFMHFGPVHVAASLALLQLAVAVLPVFAYFLFTNRCLEVV